jgi:tetratricopeptide (TPR) repeat protein
MEKNRDRRYETASAFADDLDRFLQNEPVVACPPSAGYRLRKFILRNKASVIVATATTGALLVGLALAMIGFVQARRQADRADRAAESARMQVVRSERVSAFLKDMLQGVGPSVALGRDTAMLREILDKTTQRLDDLNDQPIVEAELRTTLGNVFVELEDFDRAAAMHGKALALRKKHLGDENPEVAASLNDLGIAYYGQSLARNDKRKLTESADAHRQSLAMRRRLFGEKHPDIATSLNNLAESLRKQRGEANFAEAEKLHRESLAMRRELFGGEHLAVAASLHELGIMLRHLRKFSEGETLLREGLAMRRKLLGDEHPDVAASLNALGLLLFGAGQLVEAEANIRDALAMRRKLYGTKHRLLAESLDDLAKVLQAEGKSDEAKPLFQESAAIRRKLFENDDDQRTTNN